MARYTIDLSERDEWIRKRVKELKQTKKYFMYEIYQMVSSELNKQFPELAKENKAWVGTETVKQIYLRTGYYRDK